MQKSNKKLREQTIASITNQFLDVHEKYIEIPIVDNKELRWNIQSLIYFFISRK